MVKAWVQFNNSLCGICGRMAPNFPLIIQPILPPADIFQIFVYYIIAEIASSMKSQHRRVIFIVILIIILVISHNLKAQS